MQIIRGSSGLRGAPGGCVAGIGIFDGVHLGHQALFAEVQSLARAASVMSCAYIFDPHPARLLNPAVAPKLIEPLHMRLARLDMLGLDTVMIEPFTAELASMEASAFVREILVGRLGVRDVVVGENFTFGRGRAGDIVSLAALGRELDFGVHPIGLMEVEGISISSTKIREYIWAGALRGASLLLGRPFELSGLVVRGAERGSLLGFPTANVASRNELWPAKGVYAGFAYGGFGERQMVVNIGQAPTFGGTEVKIEAHLLDYGGGSLYGSEITLSFVDRLRDERRFDNIDDLKAQLKSDVEHARRLLPGTA